MKKQPDLLTEHRMILNECRPSIEEQRSQSPATDVIVIIDCVAFPDFAQALGLAIPSTTKADAYVLAIGAVPVDRCRQAFSSQLFPMIAKGLRDGLSTPLAYRTIVLTKRGATTAQNIYVPAHNARA
jgi:hypothetical protein